MKKLLFKKIDTFILPLTIEMMVSFISTVHTKAAKGKKHFRAWLKTFFTLDGFDAYNF